MSNQKDHEFTGNLNRVYKAVLQSGAKGIRPDKIAEKLDIDRTTVYKHLSSLRLKGLVGSEQGVWCARTGEQTIKPLEKEIVITLPMPLDQLREIASLEAEAEKLERYGAPLDITEQTRIFLEKFKEPRIIRIKGKNVDNLDLEKLGNLIQQANEKSSRVNLRGGFKSLKRSHTNDSQR